ncbi:unnamed protein product [Diatraea saccharalis]|uniref:Syndecan n=1 Tax=Diatraea saccharalis TaxID=40085 RepID=A0A9N9RHN9_9NEOP|nr:unnamed protein product [Diatraea saccharalis]
MQKGLPYPVIYRRDPGTRVPSPPHSAPTLKGYRSSAPTFTANELTTAALSGLKIINNFKGTRPNSVQKCVINTQLIASKDGTFSTSTEDTARIQNDGVAPDNVYFDDEGSGVAPDESSGSGWGAGPGPDDEDGRAGSGDAPDGDSDDEDFVRPTKAPATETPRIMPDESSVSGVAVVPETVDNFLDSLIPDTNISPDSNISETEHPIPPPDQTFDVEIPRILKPSEGAVDTRAGGAREEVASRPETDISISGEDLNPDIDHEPSGSNVNAESRPADNVVFIMNAKPEDRAASFFAQPGILAAVIGGAVVGLLCAILVVMFIVYRMRKKDEGSYALDEPKRSPAAASYGKGHNNREFYA